MGLNVAFGPQIEAAAERNSLDPTLLAAVAAQETGGPGASSGRNIVGDGGHGHGVFQIDDRWHAFAASAAAMDPAANANYAAGMLRSLLDQYGGDVRKALSAYNAGSPSATGTTTDWGDGHPVSYADSVMRHYALLAGAGGGGGISAGTGTPPSGAAATATASALAPSSATASDPLAMLLAMSPPTTTSAFPQLAQPLTEAALNVNGSSLLVNGGDGSSDDGDDNDTGL